MESWMKRGFLKSSKAGSKPNTSLAQDIIEVDRTPGAVANSTNKQQSPPPSIKIKIPSCPIDDDENIPIRGDCNVTSGELSYMRTTQLPFYGTPYAISLLYPGAKEAIAAIPGFPTPYMPSLRVNYRIGDAPGAGKGMFALTDLDVGDLILRERPLFLFPMGLPCDATMSPEQMIMLALSLMKPQDTEDFYKLANCKTGNPVLGILNTNALNASRMPGRYNGQYGAICLDLSRVNHSCNPNTTYRWSLKDVMYELRAICPIKKGEQIFISYNAPLQTRPARREHMQSSYDFKCRCPCCSLPSPESARSDIRRRLLRMNLKKGDANDDAELKAWAKDMSLPDDHIIIESMKFINMMTLEGFVDKGICNLHYPRLVKAYCALKDTANAKLWAKRAALMVTSTHGEDLGWSKVVESPESTDWWGLRKRI